jgi:hypothetical protein
MKISVGVGVLVAYFAALELFLIYESALGYTETSGPTGT